MATDNSLSQRTVSDEGILKYLNMVGAMVAMPVVMKALPEIVGEQLAKDADEYMIFSMVVDLIDPYGFGEAMTRTKINDEIKRFRDQLRTLVNQKVGGSTAFQKHIDEVCKGVPKEKREAFVQQQLDEFVNTKPIKKVYPETLDACYPDSLSPSAQSASGPPQVGCDPVYKEFYEDYILKTQGTYTRERISDGTLVAFVVKEGYKRQINDRLDAAQQNMLLYIYVCVGLLVLTLALCVWWYKS